MIDLFAVAGEKFLRKTLQKALFMGKTASTHMTLLKHLMNNIVVDSRHSGVRTTAFILIAAARTR